MLPLWLSGIQIIGTWYHKTYVRCQIKDQLLEVKSKLRQISQKIKIQNLDLDLLLATEEALEKTTLASKYAEFAQYYFLRAAEREKVTYDPS